MFYGPYSSYANGPDTVSPMPEWQNLLHAARVDALVKEVLKRVEPAGVAVVTAAPPETPTPFDGGEPAEPFAEGPFQDYEQEEAYDMFEPPSGGPVMPNEPWATGADAETYRIIGATPFDAPVEPFAESPPADTSAFRVTQATVRPLERAVRPTFDTYSRFGYPDLKADPYGNGVINAIRRMVRGAQV